MSIELLVRPVRFTDDVDAMRDFLETLGLRARVEAETGGWVELVARGGTVALHAAADSDTGAAAGETGLSFEVRDAAATCERLLAGGFADATVVDQAYGREVVVTDPLGAELVIGEQPDDLYGYRTLDGPAPSAAGVVPVRFTDDATGYDRFLTALGLTGRPAPGGYTTYASGGHGWVGVHHVYDDLPVVGPHGVHLTLAVEPEQLGELHDRLEGAGHAVVRHDEDFGSFLDVTDPDGQSVQVHPIP